MSTAKILGAAIRELRKEKGLNQTQLAELSGISLPTVSLVETGKTNPTLDVIDAMAKALDTTLPNLMAPQRHAAIPSKEELLKRVAKNVRDRREYLGLSRKQAGERVGLLPQYFATTENGRRLPLLRNLIRFAEALEVRPSWLLQEQYDPAQNLQDAPGHMSSDELVRLIEETRMEKGLSIVEVCSLAGLGSASWYKMVESKNITVPTTIKICEALYINWTRCI
ncbi:helix-turn-helix domain-containing protein [Ruegeria atlantica]|uniref:helix-turn-helix domain-containing protein n=1 Tax=Ruegeria atlantica TaxID=81569 RepID=UPI00147FC688|nr:helix-turn-helix domain-containing protein [Ruegeria atlantica]